MGVTCGCGCVWTPVCNFVELVLFSTMWPLEVPLRPLGLVASAVSHSGSPCCSVPVVLYLHLITEKSDAELEALSAALGILPLTLSEVFKIICSY